MRTAASILLSALVLTVGCQSPPQADAPVESLEGLADHLPAKQRDFFKFAPEQYPDVFEAAVESLRQHGYRIARRDYRFGTITTFPKEAATAAEFWVDDASTYAQRRLDTYNAQQRVVTVKVDQPKDQDRFSLTVEVLVQRLQRPDRYLTHSARPRISRSYTDTPMHLKNRGIEGPYAQGYGYDHRLEDRLVKAIRSASKD